MTSKQKPAKIFFKHFFIAIGVLVYISIFNVIGWLFEGVYFFWNQSAGCGINSGEGNNCLSLPFSYFLVIPCLVGYIILAMGLDMNEFSLKRYKDLIIASFSAICLLILFAFAPISWTSHIFASIAAIILLGLPTIGLSVLLYVIKKYDK